MKISNWNGLVTAASPYAIKPGATPIQNNIQLRKPGQLTPRSGLNPLYTVPSGRILALYRQSKGALSDDVLYSWRPEKVLGDNDEPVDGFAIEVLSRSTVNGVSQIDAQEIFETIVEPALRPSFCEDRHGAIFVFFGSGIPVQVYRPGIDASAVPAGLEAPTVAPAVTPEGDGWFIERVDILASGTSYYTAPTLTVIGGSPDRNAKLRAVVQAGSLVAIDVVDGGSNFKTVPYIEISNEQIGSGFSGRGIVESSQPVFGFRQQDAGALSAAYVAGRTHSYVAAGSAPAIAYKSGNETASVPASFSPATGLFSALIPLTPANNANGTDAFAEVRFQALSAAYQVGNVEPVGFTVDNTYTSTILATNPAESAKYQTRQVSWYTTNNYFQNTYTPPYNNIPTRFTYRWEANRDKFWGLGPYPYRYVFAKSQQTLVGISEDDFWGNNSTLQSWGDYYFPDYSHVSYYLLTGPENALGTKSSWSLRSSPVQIETINGVDFPFIDIPLEPALKPDGTPYESQTGTTYPEVRVYLSYCPPEWTLSNVGRPVNPNYGDRFTPQSGQDRRVNFDDTNYTPAVGANGANVAQLHSLASDERLRWWGEGHAFGLPLARPITDFRLGAANTGVGIASGTLQVKETGSLLAQGTKFAIRFYQYNAYDYICANRSRDVTWLSSTVGTSRRYRSRTVAQWDASSKGSSIDSVFTDFYLMAGAVDTSQGGLSLLLPGAVVTNPASEAPKVTISGRGWTAASQTATFTLRQQPSPTTGSFTDSDTYTFTTQEVIPAVAGKRIGSVEIISGGQNYYREPTILYQGGGGYGLKLGATTSAGRITNVAVLDGGDGFLSDTVLYTDVQPARLQPVLRGTMRGAYRCAYRFADYSQTVVRKSDNSPIRQFTTRPALDGSKTIIVNDASNLKPGLVITGASALHHLVKIVSVTGNVVTLSHEPKVVAVDQEFVARDMSLPITYSDFSPIADVTADVSGSGRASTMSWRVNEVTAPPRADHVEFFRTSADQSLVFYRLELYGTCDNGSITLADGGIDGLSDEELFDIDRPGYAALPVVLPNGGVNAFRFGVPRSDMAVGVAWQDRLWFGVSTSGQGVNTVFFSEFDEFESCPDINELPIQTNLRSTDSLTALVPFGHLLLAMQNSHTYSITYNTDPIVDASVNLVSHRGVLTHQCWDIFDDLLYAVDERGIYSMSANGSIDVLSDAVRDYFDENRIDLSKKKNFFLKVDQKTGILRLFLVENGSGSSFPHMALCYHIANQAWWTEAWPTALLCGSDYRRPGQPDAAVYGSVDGHLHVMEGLTDVSFRSLQSINITNRGSGYQSPPEVTSAGPAKFQAVISEGKVVDILILDAGWGYGSIDDVSGQPVFRPLVSLTIAPPPGNGVQAVASALARAPFVGAQSQDLNRTTVPWRFRTKAMELAYDGNTRGGDAQMDRSISVTYLPTSTSAILNLRQYYNNSSAPRPNVMPRDRGTGFVHDTAGAKTTLDMSATRTELGLSTGLATAQFAGRSLGDLSSADRHLAVELSCDARSANAGDAAPAEPLIYALEVRGVNGGE